MQEKDIEKVKDNIRQEIIDIIKRETTTEDDYYRKAKLFVFAKNIENNLDLYLSTNKEEIFILEKFEQFFLNEEHAIEKIFSYLYETNKNTDCFMNKNKLLYSITFFLENNF